MRLWDNTSGMTRDEWRAACLRTSDGTQMRGVDALTDLPPLDVERRR
jgi:hypothetical protein